MLHSSKGRVSSPAEAARDARRELARLARPSGEFDASRYFRDSPRIPRTTVRYAIERFPLAKRRALLNETKHGR